MPDLTQAREFLELVFTGALGKIELRPIEVDGAARPIFCDDIEQALRAVERAAAAGMNCYVGIATRRSTANGTKANLRQLGALWCDVDFQQDPQGERELLEVRLETFPLAPSFRVWSGGGVHLYWILREPLDVTTSESRERVESILKGLADHLGGDRAATDTSRVLRVPGTVNYPDARKRERGRVPAECRLA